MTPVVVAKVGGSLFDLPDLRNRLSHWARGIRADQVLLVPGGGQAADAVRRLDRTHQLGESASHWLALRVLTVNAHFVATLLSVPVVISPQQPGGTPITVLDPCEFCRNDEGTPGAVAHSWRVTSDSIAARVAATVGGQLVLLKSVDLPEGSSWEAASAAGLVDEAFPEMIRRDRVPVEWVNLRRHGRASRE